MLTQDVPQILDDISFHKIQIYQPPTYENDDPETIQENKEIIVGALFLPLLLVGVGFC